MAYRSASKSQSPISLKSGVPPGKPDVGSDHTMEGKNESLDLPPSIKTTTSPEPRRFVSRQSANFDESNDFLRTGTRSPELMCSSAATASSCNPLFRPPSDISIFIFGGFILDEPEEVDYSDKKVSKFKASNDLLKIDLKASQKLPFLNAINFADEALMVKVGSDKSCDLAIEENEIWPSPRGYFACTLVNYLVGVEACSRDVSAREGELTGVKKPEPSKYVPMKESSSQDSSQIEKFFDDRAFIIQGGCTENNQIYGDFYRFAFKTCKWEKVITYAYDHYNIPINTDDDEVANMLTKGNEIKNPELKEAEFRCCHHTALHYRNEERDYVFIIGGVKNTHLRLYNHEQYISDKIDVSRLAALLLTTTNPNLLRVGVLNTQTQTWRFMRYSNDMAGALTCAPVFDSYLESARIAHIGGTASINGKIITLAQGLASISPNKKADIEYLKEDFPIEELLFGGYVQFTFPVYSGASPQISSQQKLQAAEAELDMVTGMFNALVSQCHTKCINKAYNESDLNKQESLCLDRCVSKYFETNVQVGENMQKLGQSGQFMGRR
ncbi:TIM10 Mitochondrial import inner membrane translocase subunit TIM10 [Candida maltosa Xu316]